METTIYVTKPSPTGFAPGKAPSMIEMLIPLIREAGAEIMKVYRSGDFSVTAKTDLSPVTDADLASNRILCEGLLKTTGIPVVSEEVEVTYEQRSQWNEFWLIDPLDGTKDYIARNDEFAINIALIRGCRPVLGMIHAPARQELHYAEEGKGAYRLEGNTRVRLPYTRIEGRVVGRSRFHDSPEVNEFCRLNSVTQSLPIGSSLKFTQIAEGTVNLYPRYTGCSEWDTAAGQILVTESGGWMIDLSTLQPPRYNKPSIKNAFFIAGGASVAFSELKLP